MEAVKSFKSKETQLILLQDDNKQWRSGGKAGNTDVPYQEKHPYILDRNHYFTKLILAYHHKLL